MYETVIALKSSWMERTFKKVVFKRNSHSLLKVKLNEKKPPGLEVGKSQVQEQFATKGHCRGQSYIARRAKQTDLGLTSV